MVIGPYKGALGPRVHEPLTEPLPGEHCARNLFKGRHFGMAREETSQTGDLQALFEAMDQLDTLREGAEGLRSDSARTRFRQQKLRLRRRIETLLAERLPDEIEEPLAACSAERGFGPAEMLLLATLLHQRVRYGEYGVTGRDLLWVLADSTYDTFLAMKLLQSEAPLVASGTVTIIVDPDEADDLLNRQYVLSPDLYNAICSGVAPERDHAGFHPPYMDGVDMILDLGNLSLACQRRAARVFEFGLWRELHGEPWESAEELSRRIDTVHRNVTARVEATPHAAKLEPRRLQTELGLTDLELLVVATMLWLETVAGTPSLDAIDVVRLVSDSPRDLLRKRRLLAANSTLTREGLLVFDDALGDKALTGQVYLAEWVTERLVDGDFRGDRAIGSDEKIEFHSYLSRLDGTDDFFDRL